MIQQISPQLRKLLFLSFLAVIFSIFPPIFFSKKLMSFYDCSIKNDCFYNRNPYEDEYYIYNNKGYDRRGNASYYWEPNKYPYGRSEGDLPIATHPPDKYRFDQYGYDRFGYNKNGFSRDGYDREGYNRHGYDRRGYDRQGYNRNGFDSFGINKDGFDVNGNIVYEAQVTQIPLPIQCYDPDKRGFYKCGESTKIITIPRYRYEWTNKLQYSQDKRDKDGYSKEDFDKQGYDKDGYNRFGYDRYGNQKPLK